MEAVLHYQSPPLRGVARNALWQLHRRPVRHLKAVEAPFSAEDIGHKPFVLRGETAVHLTERDKEVGMEPRWVPLDEIIQIFSKHADYADRDEMRRGMYLREYTALSKLCGGVSSGKQGI